MQLRQELFQIYQQIYINTQYLSNLLKKKKRKINLQIMQIATLRRKEKTALYL